MKYLILFSSLLLYSCANMGTLTGGDMDTIAPELTSNNITKTNFKGKTISLEFNEYVVLNNPTKNIVLLPKHSSFKVSVLRKKVLIQFDTSLHENTTYQLYIDGGIQDNNAHNSFYYNTTFSTGESLDSGVVNITIPEYKEYKNLKLCLTEDNGRDSFKNFNSDYIYEVNNTNYLFTGLSDKKRTIWLFVDDNLDNIPDLYKPINFISNTTIDSTYYIDLQPWMKPFSVYKKQTDLTYDKIHYTTLKSHRTDLAQKLNISAEKIIYSTEDSALLFSSIIVSEKIDTVSNLKIKPEIESYVKNGLLKIQLLQNYLVTYSLPNIYNNDTLSSKAPVQFINFKNKTDTLVFLSPLGTDTISILNIPYIDANKLSFLKIEINDSLNRLFDIVILKDAKPFQFFSGYNSYQNYLNPGEYTIEIRELNSLYHFNPFTMQKSAPVIYNKTIHLKASWEEILLIKP